MAERTTTTVIATGNPPTGTLPVRAYRCTVPGLILTSTHPRGHTWQITHETSGCCVSHKAWPTEAQADAAAVACCAAVDWTRSADELAGDQDALAARQALTEWVG